MVDQGNVQNCVFPVAIAFRPIPSSCRGHRLLTLLLDNPFYGVEQLHVGGRLLENDHKFVPAKVLEQRDERPSDHGLGGHSARKCRIPLFVADSLIFALVGDQRQILCRCHCGLRPTMHLRPNEHFCAPLPVVHEELRASHFVPASVVENVFESVVWQQLRIVIHIVDRHLDGSGDHGTFKFRAEAIVSMHQTA